MDVKSPGLIMGCQGTPTLFCPALDEEDATTFMNAHIGLFTMKMKIIRPQHHYHLFKTHGVKQKALTLEMEMLCLEIKRILEQMMLSQKTECLQPLYPFYGVLLVYSL